MVVWIFGFVKSSLIIYSDERTAGGLLTLEKAQVNWHLSIENICPTPTRYMFVDEKKISFDQILTGLHEKMYREIINNNWYRIEETRPSIELVHKMRSKI